MQLILRVEVNVRFGARAANFVGKLNDRMKDYNEYKAEVQDYRHERLIVAGFTLSV